MSNWLCRFAIVLSIVTLLLASPAWADEAEASAGNAPAKGETSAKQSSSFSLPDQLITAETIMAGWLDVQAATTGEVSQSAARVSPALGLLLTPVLAQADELRTQFLKAGGRRIGVVIFNPFQSELPDVAIVYGTDSPKSIESLQKMVEPMFGGPKRVSFAVTGRYLIATPPYRKYELPEKGDPAHKKVWEEAMSHAKGPAGMVFVPSAAFTKQIQEELADEVDDGDRDEMAKIALDLIQLTIDGADCRWAAASITLGNEPSVQGLGMMKNEADAKKFMTRVEPARTALKNMFAYDRKRSRRYGMHADPFGIATYIIFQSTQVKREGAKISLSLDLQRAARGIPAITAAVQYRQKQRDQWRVENNARQLAWAVRNYARKNKDNLPDSLQDLKSVMDEKQFKQIITDAKSDKPAFIYIKPAQTLQEIADQSTTAVIYEAEDGQIAKAGVIAYLDGHTQSPPAAFPEIDLDGASGSDKDKQDEAAEELE